MLNDSSTKDANPKVAICAQFLEASPQVPPMSAKVETLVNAKFSAGEERASQVELKPLPSYLRYELLGPNSTSLMIVNLCISASQIDSLIKAIRYTFDNLKGPHSFMCMHRIVMEDYHKPSMEHQRRLNPNMQEIFKKEILNQLRADIIYPISDSKWVSPVHVLLKKGGMTVIKNENNELLPIRIVTGWRMCVDY